MKRLVLVALAVTALALVSALPGGADTVGDASPACADISEGSNAAYNVEGVPNNSVTGILFLSDTSCRGIFYEMWVSYTSGGQQKVRVDINRGDGVNPFVRFEIDNVFSDDGTVCVGFTTSRGPNLLDRAPDPFSPPATGCVTVVADSSGGGSFW
jgi:hypothetical protein